VRDAVAARAAPIEIRLIQDKVGGGLRAQDRRMKNGPMESRLMK
jgi:hypothetical protein